jgi:hypothetical protein
VPNNLKEAERRNKKERGRNGEIIKIKGVFPKLAKTV